MSAPETMRLLGYGRRRPKRAPDGRWLVWFRRTGEGAGTAFSAVMLDPSLHWPEVSAARRRLGRLPADMGIAAVMTEMARAYAPLMTRRLLRERRAPAWAVERAVELACSPEFGVGEAVAAPGRPGMRITHPVPTGRYITPGGSFAEGGVYLIDTGEQVEAATGAAPH